MAQRYTMDNFSPPALQPPLWATFIPDRTTKPQFATHKTIGPAKGAFNGLDNAGILYEYDPQANGWIERFRWTREDRKNLDCYQCGKKLTYSKEVEWQTTSTGQVMARARCSFACSHP